MPKQPCRCIDISHYQGRPNFTQVKAAGVLAMIHKATEGTGYSDPDRATNCSNALKAGIAVCTYHFLKHGNADAQMDYYCSVVQPANGERLIIDYEDSACTIGDLHEAVQQLLDKGKGKNWQITVYSGNLLKEQLGSSHDALLAANTDLWLAQYTSGTPSWPTGTYPNYSLWQYSESGTIPGISDAAVDLNDFNGSDENLLKWMGPVGAEPAPPPVVATLPPPLDDATFHSVLDIANKSAIARYSWKDRGRAPTGYMQGMAVAWSTVLRKYLLNDPAALDMSKAKTTNADVDVLSWYAGKFADAGMDNSADGIDTLRHLFALLMGLGMRETSGQHCCGRDQSASNTDSMTCEAGLFQMSWNASSSTPLMQQVMDQYDNATGLCALEQFKQDVECSGADWKCYGSGEGYKYQELAKTCPQFAVETTLLGLRHIRMHWGPINRYEAELKSEADQMLADVQALVMEGIPTA